MKYVDKIKVSRAELLALTQNSQHESLDELRTHDTIDFNDHPDLFELFQEYLLLGDQLRIGTQENYPTLLESASEGSIWAYPFEVGEDEDYVELMLPKRWFTKSPDEVIRKHDAVAIDFGTKSTVVAIKSQGHTRLLRIGIENWSQLPVEEDYENASLLQVHSSHSIVEGAAWSTVRQRPPIYTQEVKHANTVIRDLEDAILDPDPVKKLAYIQSLITGLKSKLIAKQDVELINDQENNQLLHVTYGQEGEFDAIEYYAWLLGLHVNLNQTGFFPRYYLSFPVDCPSDKKKNMQQSFERGILRSLPEVIRRNEDFMKRFQVKLYVSEPAAFAASAIMSYEEELEPEGDDKGTFFTVFDVGGGTSDYFFGNHRWSTEEGDEADHERIIESFGTGGQRHLGGEHLLAELAFLVYTENSEAMIADKIPFEPPQYYDVNLVQGTSHLLTHELAARANTTILMSLLRRNFHVSPDASWVVGSSDLFDRGSQKITLSLDIPYEKLFQHLAQRFEEGVRQFLRDLLKLLNAQEQRIPRIKIIRSGNTSRSIFLQRIFEPDAEGAYVTLNDPTADDALQATLSALPSITQLADEVFAEAKFGTPRLIVLPLLKSTEARETNPEPTMKTGTALGILQLIPGSETMLKHIKEDLFTFDVGTKSRGKFKVVLARGPVDQEWVEVCNVVDGGANILFTQSNREELRSSDPEVYSKHVTSHDLESGTLWIKPDGQRSIRSVVTEKGQRPQPNADFEVILLDG